jgi:D-lactate dehydrogenase (cytochrome)
LRGILQFSAEDLYVTVRAGTPIVDLQRCAAEKGFWIPMIAPWQTGTIAGAVASNANSPLRSLYGGLRDQVLCLQVALADGRLLRYGKPLVKDVAGYSMSKLFVGSYGTLGMITEVTLKLFPRPRFRRSLLIRVPNLEAGLAWASAAQRSAVICSGIVLVSEYAGDLPGSGYTLVYTAEGHPADVAAETQAAHRMLESVGAPSPIETDETDAAREWERVAASGDFVARIGLPACDLMNLISSIDLSQVGKTFAIDALNSTILLADEPSRAGEMLLRMRRLTGPQGYALMEAGPRQLLGQIDAWGDSRSAHHLMRALKLRWDPADVLNRNEWISIS